MTRVRAVAVGTWALVLSVAAAVEVIALALVASGTLRLSDPNGLLLVGVPIAFLLSVAAGQFLVKAVQPGDGFLAASTIFIGSFTVFANLGMWASALGVFRLTDRTGPIVLGSIWVLPVVLTLTYLLMLWRSQPRAAVAANLA